MSASKLLLVAFFALFLGACNGGSSEDGVSNQEEPRETDSTSTENNEPTMANACLRNEVIEGEARDLFVSFDSLGNEGFVLKTLDAQSDIGKLSFSDPSTLEAYNRGLAYTLVIGKAATDSVVLLTVTALVTPYCNFDIWNDNACTTDFGSQVLVFNQRYNDGVLSYSVQLHDALESPVTYRVTLTGNNMNTGSIQIEGGDVDQNIVWSRSIEGNESYAYSDTLGNSIELVEYPDCSGRYSSYEADSETGEETESIAVWESVHDEDFQVEFEVCEIIDSDTGAKECSGGIY